MNVWTGQGNGFGFLPCFQGLGGGSYFPQRVVKMALTQTGYSGVVSKNVGYISIAKLL